MGQWVYELLMIEFLNRLWFDLRFFFCAALLVSHSAFLLLKQTGKQT